MTKNILLSLRGGWDGVWTSLDLCVLNLLLKLINNSKVKDKGNHAPWRVWISDEKLLVFASLNSPSKSVVWEVTSNTRHSVSSLYKKPRSSSKILRYSSYFQLSSRYLISDETLCLVFDILHVTSGFGRYPIDSWFVQLQTNKIQGLFKDFSRRKLVFKDQCLFSISTFSSPFLHLKHSIQS